MDYLQSKDRVLCYYGTMSHRHTHTHTHRHTDTHTSSALFPIKLWLHVFEKHEKIFPN